MLLRHREADEDRLDLRDGDERGVLAGLDEVAEVDEPGAGAPVDRRADVGVLQVEVGGVDLRLVGGEGAFQLADPRLKQNRPFAAYDSKASPGHVLGRT